MAQPVIVYDPAGSNTAASGAGPATALTGTNAVPTSQVIALDGTPDLSGVATDGSDVIYFESTDDAANRRLFKITAVDDGADTVTVVGTIVGTGVNWAIGGKRLNFENSARDDWRDWDSGWDASIEGTDSVILLTAGMVITAGDRTDGPVTIRGLAGTKQTLDVTSTIRQFTLSTSGAHVVIENLDFTRSSGTWTGNYGVYITSTMNCVVRKCTFNSANMQDGVHDTGSGSLLVEDCEMSLMGGQGVYFSGGRVNLNIRRNSCHDLDGHGINLAGASSFPHVVVQRNLCYDNGGDGIRDAMTDVNNAAVYIIDNICDRNTSDGLEVVDAPHANATLYIEGNFFTSNGAYGVAFPATTVGLAMLNRNNHYDSNTSGDRLNLAAGIDDTSGDPKYTVTTDGSEDYTLQGTSPGKDAGSTQRTV